MWCQILGHYFLYIYLLDTEQSLLYTAIQKFRVGKIFKYYLYLFYYFYFEVFYAHQGHMYLIRYTVQY